MGSAVGRTDCDTHRCRGKYPQIILNINQQHMLHVIVHLA
uniref:Uncharacterized protein n=1 Tax=Anguilla anguilla TaxID=7936 RepID=A0A0E9SWU5_ANGAN